MQHNLQYFTQSPSSLLQPKREDSLVTLSSKIAKTFRVTNEVKLSVFQYKIVHDIVVKNNILHKMKNKRQPDCPYCHNIDQTQLNLLFCEMSNYLIVWE